jgi:hypothetical protein
MFPRTLTSSGAHDDWPLLGFAMLARASGTLGSVMALIPERRAADAAVLNRTLFEEVVTFAWIAVDPAANATAWVRWDRRERLKLDNDLRDHGAPALLAPSRRQEFEALVASGPSMPSNLADRAREADAHWLDRIDALDDDPRRATSFRTLYRYAYRGDSRFVHGAVGSVDGLVIDSLEPGKRVVLPVERDPGNSSAFERAPFVLGVGLLVAEVALDLDGLARAVDRIFGMHRPR